jgi:predicted ester cyclase
VWNQGKESTIDELAGPDREHPGLGPSRPAASWAGGVREFYRGFRSAFTDFKVYIDDVLAEGDKTIARVRFSGKLTGEGLGIPPTGKTFQSSAIVIVRWQNGQIVEGWNEFDAVGMMEQLTAPAQAPIKLKP